MVYCTESSDLVFLPLHTCLLPFIWPSSWHFNQPSLLQAGLYSGMSHLHIPTHGV